jgi:RNA polymerase sigma-70 factor (ECF subfamily)
MLRLYPRVEELEVIKHLRPWLNRVLYRQFVDNFRKQRRRREMPASQLFETDEQSDFFEAVALDCPGVVDQINAHELQALFRKILQTLSADQRTLLLLHDVDGWSQEGIAQVLGVAVGTVKSRLHRSRNKIRERVLSQLEPFEVRERVGQ